ncbi:unnamed protein product, partial [Scytosiphon promiscuus]
EGDEEKLGQQAMADALSFGTQEPKTKKRRSRLSLPPKKRGGTERSGELTAAVQIPQAPVAPDSAPPNQESNAVEGGEEEAKKEKAEEGDWRATSRGVGVDAGAARGRAAPSPAAAAIAVAMDVDVEPSPTGRESDGKGATGLDGSGGDGDTDIEECGGANSPERRAGGDDGARANAEEIGEDGGGKRNGGSSITARHAGGDSEEEVVEDEDSEDEIEDTASLGEGEGERASVASEGVGGESLDDGLLGIGRANNDGGVSSGAGATAAAAVAGGTRRYRMMMDVGDSDSDSSDGDENRGGTGADCGGTGAVHLARAFEEAVEYPGSAPPSSPSPPLAAAGAAAASPPSPQSEPADGAGCGSAAAADDDDQAALQASAQTPPTERPIRRGKGKARNVPESSPAAEAMGLVDTPSPKKAEGSRAGDESPPASAVETRDKAGQKGPVRRVRALERLAWNGAGSQPLDSQLSPSLSSPQGSGGRGGGWACPACTLINRARAKSCTACFTSRAPTPPMTRATSRYGTPTPSALKGNVRDDRGSGYADGQAGGGSGSGPKRHRGTEKDGRTTGSGDGDGGGSEDEGKDGGRSSGTGRENHHRQDGDAGTAPAKGDDGGSAGRGGKARDGGGAAAASSRAASRDSEEESDG